MPGHKLYENGWTLEGRDARKQALRVWWLTEWGDARSITLLSEWLAHRVARCSRQALWEVRLPMNGIKPDIDVMEKFVVSANPWSWQLCSFKMIDVMTTYYRIEAMNDPLLLYFFR